MKRGGSICTPCGCPNEKEGSFMNPLCFLCRCHAAALFSAGIAGFCTCLAMILIMFFAFCAARFTNIGAKCTDFFYERAVRLHRFGCQSANIRAFPVKPMQPLRSCCALSSKHFVKQWLQASIQLMQASIHACEVCSMVDSPCSVYGFMFPGCM